MSQPKRTIAEYILDSYKASGLSRRRFLRRLALQITGAGAIIAAFSKKAKSCHCQPCNICNGCNASCDVHVCLASNHCYTTNTCLYNSCLEDDTCHGSNNCRTDICQQNNVCTTNVCNGDTCSSDTCGTNTCNFNTCTGNVCFDDDGCIYLNECVNADVDCGVDDFSCVVNWCVNE